MRVKIIVTDDQDQEQIIKYNNVEMLMTRKDCIFLTFEGREKEDFNFEGRAFQIAIKNY